MSTTVRTNTENPSTATMPLMAWYGPSSRTTCQTTAVQMPETTTPAIATSTEISNTRGDRRTSERNNTIASAAPNRLSSGAIAIQSIGGTASGFVGALLS